jgi:DNA-binding MarR family transcriptional regulator
MPETIRLAEHLLALSKSTWIEGSRDTADLSETEFLALDHLAEAGTTTVGVIQKHTGVLPAQMSRILRRLEDEGFVSTAMNRTDRRKVDVSLTDSGRRRHARYRQAKLAPLLAALERLTPEERSLFMGLVEKMTRRPQG